MTTRASDDAPQPPPVTGLFFCVLASGSSGNCSVLVHRTGPEAPRRVVLLDAGLSPRRTGRLLSERGIRPDEVDDIVFTHLDTDHCHAGWASAIRPGGWRARLRVHRRHMGRAERAGLLFNPTEPFDDSLTIDRGLSARVGMMAHDELGVAAFRFAARTHAAEAHLGFATDVGRAGPGLIGLLKGVDLLAIESNYCPEMQALSDRPEFLKRRITGGSGHLSNQESARASRSICPRERLVLLHLSRQCNTPEAASRSHADSGCPVSLSDQHTPTPWYRIAGRACRVEPEPTASAPVRSLFDLPSAGGAAW